MIHAHLHARALIGAIVVALLLASSVPAAAVVRDDDAAAFGPGTSSTYIVRLTDDPVVAYEGGVSGIAATAPKHGEKVDAKSAKVQRYVSHLAKRHADVAASVGATPFYEYFYSLNGFAATLTSKQAAALRKRADVAAVEKDELARIETSSTADFLGLSTAGSGLWAQVGGVANAGEDIIVGVIDTGIWPEHPSFSDNADQGDASGNSGADSLAYGPAPAGWSGSCQSGEQFSQDDCNNKLIGARYYLSGFGHFGILKSDVKSARDYDSHGTHTASTIAGNHGVQATGPAAVFGTITGMAPRARIAAYKVCWNGDAGGCATSDSVAAIDQAVADGVDVINFSISGTSTLYLNAVEVAFLFAARAGVFVATSAGNAGPGAGTVAHISPWLAAVAAGTHDRSTTAKVVLGNGTTITGSSVFSGAGPAQFIKSQTAGLASADPNLVRQCFSGTLDPAKVGGKIVLCERGNPGPLNARVDKSAAVRQAGGVGVVIANTTLNSVNADFHEFPTVHVDHIAWPTLAGYIEAQGAAATATLTPAVIGTGAPAPDVAGFSSRGPSRAGAGDILKPDFMAPGVDILAGVSPAAGGRLFDILSGTSMSSPHVAGIGALLKQAKPGWSPAAMRSALATTADANPNPGSAATKSPFAIGSGQVRPSLATDPGLVYDAAYIDYLRFLKGQGLCCGSSASISAIDASDLNQPTIAIGDLAGTQTVTRRVTNVGPKATYRAKVSLEGFKTTVTPSRLTLATGESATYTVSFVRTDAPLGTYSFGSLDWSDGKRQVSSRIALRPVAIAAPASITGTGAAGSATYGVRFGYSGTFNAVPRGLVAATKTAGSVADDPNNDFVTTTPDANKGITVHTFVVPAGTKYARWSLFDSEVDGAHDLDMYVYRGATGATLAGASAGGTSAEEVNLVNPVAGTYRVYIHGWQTAGGGTASYTLSSWQVPSSSAGNLTVAAPANASTGATAQITASWSGLSAATRYLGVVTYDDGATEHGRTVVNVTVP